MAMALRYRNAVADAGAALITYVGLVDARGIELDGPGYRRQAVTWRRAVDGAARPTEDLRFDIPAGSVVAGWRGYDAPMGGSAICDQAVAEERFNGVGVYTLLADGTGVVVDEEA